LKILPAHISTKEQFIELFLHEVCRVFVDRLIDSHDRDQFFLQF